MKTFAGCMLIKNFTGAKLRAGDREKDVSTYATGMQTYANSVKYLGR